MVNKRQDIKAKLMYKEYQKGFSLEKIGLMFGISRQSVYEMFKRRSYDLRIQKKLPYLFFNGEKFTLRKTGYYASTKNSRNLMHREVWKYYNGKIPKGFDIHHKDRDRSNNKIENLELIKHSEHSKKYATGNNQFTKNI